MKHFIASLWLGLTAACANAAPAHVHGEARLEISIDREQLLIALEKPARRPARLRARATQCGRTASRADDGGQAETGEPAICPECRRPVRVDRRRTGITGVRRQERGRPQRPRRPLQPGAVPNRRRCVTLRPVCSPISPSCAAWPSNSPGRKASTPGGSMPGTRVSTGDHAATCHCPLRADLPLASGGRLLSRTGQRHGRRRGKPVFAWPERAAAKARCSI